MAVLRFELTPHLSRQFRAGARDDADPRRSQRHCDRFPFGRGLALVLCAAVGWLVPVGWTSPVPVTAQTPTTPPPASAPPATKTSVGQPPEIEVWPGGPKRATSGPDAWEYQPYKVQVWLTLESVPEVPAGLRADLERTLHERTDVVFGATWDMTVAPPPALFAAELLYRLDRFPAESLVSQAKLGKLAAPPKKPASGSQAPGSQAPGSQASGGQASGSQVSGGQVSGGSSAPAETKTEDRPADPLVEELRQVFRGDKLIVATLRAVADRWIVAACEFDIKARRWGPLVQYDCFDLALASDMIADAVHESFYPIALVNYGRDKKVQLKIRAGRLAMRDDSPVLLNEQSLLQPYLRSNDRYGEPKAQGGLQEMPWTYLIVKNRDTSRIECEIHTGIRTSLIGRNTLRTERFALGVRPEGGTTHLQLRTNEKPVQPLSGYDVYAKDPNSEAIELLGRTDWRGTMDVPYKSEFPLRLVYVKNGNSLLARLPLVPGVEPAMVVDLVPDDRRLQAEGFVSGMQNVITDLVARRELLTKRIRKKLEEQKLGEVDELLNELRSLETRDDVQKIIDLQQPRMTATQPRVQQKIDKLFEDTRKLLYKFVDPNLEAKVKAEVERARTGGGAGGPIDVINSPAPPPPVTGGAAPSTPAPSTPAPGTPPGGAPAGAPGASGPPAGNPPAGAPPAGVAPPGPAPGGAPAGAPRPSGAGVGTP